QHDALVMPSRFEGCPMTLMEAMSQGCPAIVSRIAGVTDMIVTDGNDGLLFPIGDCARAARQIDRLADDPQLHNRMAEAALEKVASTFDSDIVGRAYVDLLRQLHRERPEIAPPLALSQWSMPNAL